MHCQVTRSRAPAARPRAASKSRTMHKVCIPIHFIWFSFGLIFTIYCIICSDEYIILLSWTLPNLCPIIIIFFRNPILHHAVNIVVIIIHMHQVQDSQVVMHHLQQHVNLHQLLNLFQFIMLPTTKVKLLFQIIK